MGDFKTLPPETVAYRLSAVFESGTVIWVRRHAIEMFLSVYRQRLKTWVEILPQALENGFIPPRSRRG